MVYKQYIFLDYKNASWLEQEFTHLNLKVLTFNAGWLVLKEKWKVLSGLVKDLKVWELLFPSD